MRWVACIACLLLVGGAEAGRYRNGKVSWYAQPAHIRRHGPAVAARHGVARKGQAVVIARKDGSRAKRYRICCLAKLRRDRAFDLSRGDFSRYALPSRGLTTIRFRILPKGRTRTR